MIFPSSGTLPTSTAVYVPASSSAPFSSSADAHFSTDSNFSSPSYKYTLTWLNAAFIPSSSSPAMSLFSVHVTAGVPGSSPPPSSPPQPFHAKANNANPIIYANFFIFLSV